MDTMRPELSVLSNKVWDTVAVRVGGRVYIAVWNRIADRVATPIWESSP